MHTPQITNYPWVLTNHSLDFTSTVPELSEYFGREFNLNSNPLMLSVGMTDAMNLLRQNGFLSLEVHNCMLSLRFYIILYV